MTLWHMFIQFEQSNIYNNFRETDMKHYALLCISLLTLQTANGMESTEPPLVKINNKKESAHFIGRFIAYFNKRIRNNEGFVLDCHDVRFGRVEERNFSSFSDIPAEDGYLIRRILKLKDIHGTCAVTNYILKKDDLCVRVLTRDEFTRLKKAIESGDACLEYKEGAIYKPEVQRLLLEEEEKLKSFAGVK